MRCLRPIVPFLLVVTICWAAADAHAGRFLHHKKHLTVQQKVAYFQRSLRHERQVVAWLESRFAPRTLERHTELRWYRAALRWHTALRAQYAAKLHPVDHGVAAVQARIMEVFGAYGSQAVAVSRCETGGTFWPGASNGQYHGIFQMGDYARARYGDYPDARGQARAAYAYFVDSGKDWSPWECKP